MAAMCGAWRAPRRATGRTDCSSAVRRSAADGGARRRRTHPALILLLGIDDAMKIFIVAFAVFFPVLVNTVAGVRAVDHVAIDVARTLCVGRVRTAMRVVLPAIMPYILSGMRVSLALALIVTVVAEMIAGSSDIGYYISTMQCAMRSGDMHAAIFVLAALGYGLNRGFLAIEHRVLHWYQL